MEKTTRLLDAINAACVKFENQKIHLADLQAQVESIASALEGVDSNVTTALDHFVAQLEYLRVMYESNEQYVEVAREIASLRNALARKSSVE